VAYENHEMENHDALIF